MIDLKKDIFARLVISAKSFKEIELEDNPMVEPDKPISPISTIESKIENPVIIEIKKELDDAEEIFLRIREKEKNKKLIFSIQNKLLTLRQLVDEKSYF